MPSLHDYQRRAADFVVDHPFAFLMLEVGLGKTAVVLTALRRLVAYGEVRRVLVVAPKRVAEHVWVAERDLWAPDLDMALAIGTPKERLAAIASEATITVIGRDNVPWLVEQFGRAWPFDTLVLDESQSFKDQAAKRFKALRKVGLHERTILMSATPASESLMGLWAQVFLADRGERLGKAFTAFRSAFFESDYMGYRWSLKNGAEGQIRARIADAAVAMRAEDYLDLPERIDNVVTVSLSESERRRYEQLERDYMLPLADTEITAANAAVLFGKLAQLAGGAVYDEAGGVQEIHRRKLDALAEIVEAANGAPVLVFYSYRHERDRIIAELDGAEELDVARWNAGKQRVAVAHPASCGAGLNLQHGGSLMVWFSLPPSLELYTQACGRLHRQGQTSAVVIHHLIVEESIDETIYGLLRDKADVQNRLIDSLRERLSQC